MSPLIAKHGFDASLLINKDKTVFSAPARPVAPSSRAPWSGGIDSAVLPVLSKVQSTTGMDKPGLSNETNLDIE